MSSQISQVGTTISFQQQSSYVITPTQIPGCALWLDAADASTMTFAGSKVSQWNDKSGNGRNAVQAVSGSQPTYTTYGLNFANASMATTLTSVPIYENAFVIGYISSTGGDIFAPTTGGGRRNRFIGANLYYEAQSVATLLYSPTTINANTSYLFNFNATPSSLAILINGTTSASTNGCNSTNFTGGGTTNIGFNGLLYEMVIFSTALTTPQRQQVEGYLAWKWGLTGNLPTNHPYAINPPAYFGGTLPLINYIGLSAQTGYIQAPTQIPGCALWLDGSDASTMTLSGANITQWKDKSANASTATGTGNSGQYPTIVTNYQNGLSAVNFGYFSQQCFTLPSSAVDFGTGDFAIFFATNVFRGVGLYSFFGKVSSPNPLWRYSANNGRTDTFIYTNSSGTVSTSYKSLANGWIVGSIIATRSTGVYIYVNGSIAATTLGANTTSLSNSGTVYIGSDGTGTSSQDKLGEIIFYTNTITATQRQQIEGYLAWKWGLQANLPSSHPYYVAAPAYFGTLPIQASLTFQKQWRPTNISGCALWLDAADLSSIVLSGSSVTQWNDKSGNGRNATASGTPTLLPNSLNFNSGIQFSGTTPTFTTPSFVLSPNSTISAFVVATATKSVSQNVNLLTSTPYTNFSIYLNYSGTTKFSTYTAGSINNDTSFTNTQVPNIYELVYSPNTATPYVNGTAYTSYTQTPGTTLTTSQTLGCFNNGANTFIEYEVLFFNAALTNQQRQQVEGYLAWKWGITSSLPNNHPNKYMPPS